MQLGASSGDSRCRDRRGGRAGVIAIVLAASLGVTPARPQQVGHESGRPLSADPYTAYERLVDRLFSRAVRRTDIFVIRVFVQPGFGPEWQVTLTESRAGAVLEYALADRSLSRFLDEKGGDVGPAGLDAVAATVHIARQEASVSQQEGLALRDSFVAALDKNLGELAASASRSAAGGTVDVTLDGDAIVVAFSQGLNTIRAELTDPTAGPLKGWALDLRGRVTGSRGAPPASR